MSLRPVLLLSALLVLLLGCSGASGADEATGEAQGQEMADAVVHAQADDLAGELRAVAWLERSVYLDSRVPLRVHAEYPDTDIERQLLVSDRETGEYGAPVFHLVARISVHLVPGSTSGWNQPGEATVARCFAYEVRRDQAAAPDETDCPDTEPLRVDTLIRVPDQPSVGEADERAVRRFLRRGGDVTGLPRLQARLGRGLTARVEDVEGVVAVAVTARPDGTDCVLGLRHRSGRVAVWYPERIHTAPGEMGCVPRLATNPPL